MKILAIIFFSLLTISVSGQNYPFAREFVKGTIVLNDSTKRHGLLKWFPDPSEKLKFKDTQGGPVSKYTPEDLLGFTSDTLQFVSLFNLEVYADNYALLGKTIKVKHTFGQRLDSGKFNIYFITLSGYNAMAGSAQTYYNFIFEKKVDSNNLYVPYPFEMRMRDKRYETAKENLFIFFRDYPDIIAKIKAYKQQDNFLDIIELMRKLN